MFEENFYSSLKMLFPIPIAHCFNLWNALLKNYDFWLICTVTPWHSGIIRRRKIWEIAFSLSLRVVSIFSFVLISKIFTLKKRLKNVSWAYLWYPCIQRQSKNYDQHMLPLLYSSTNVNSFLSCISEQNTWQFFCTETFLFSHEFMNEKLRKHSRLPWGPADGITTLREREKSYC